MEFNGDRDLLLYIANLQKDCEFSLRTMPQREANVWKNCFTMLKLIKKASRRSVKLDYGKYVFEEQILEIQKGLDIISDLYVKDTNGKASLTIPNYNSFKIEGDTRLTFVGSKSEYGWIKSEDYPLRYLSFRVQNDRLGTLTNENLLKEGLAFYPNVKEAILDLFELHYENFNDAGKFYIIIPDYRSRIESLKLMFSKAEIQIDSPEVAFEDLLVSVFAKSGIERLTMPDIKLSNGAAEIDVKLQPDTLLAVLFSRSDNLKIDEKEFAKWRGEKEGVIIERTEEEIIALTREGENQTLEYKYEIENDNAKNEFIESVISFLNTNNGVILVGVDDQGNIIGTRKSEDDVYKLIHDSCDPPPANIKVEKREIAGNILLIVEVSEGDERPYQSKRNKQWYIRHNANDMIMERSELQYIIQKKESPLLPA